MQKERKIKTRFDVDEHSWRVPVWTDETFCSDWPDAGRSCPFFQSGLHLFFPLLRWENTNLGSANSGTVVLLWPPAEPPALLEAAKRDICVTDLFAVNDWAITAAGLLLKGIAQLLKMLLFISGKKFKGKIDTNHICTVCTTLIPKGCCYCVKQRIETDCNHLQTNFSGLLLPLS